MPAKSIQKPREQKNSSGALYFDWALDAYRFHDFDFLPLPRRVIRKSNFSALEQFLLTILKFPSNERKEKTVRNRHT